MELEVIDWFRAWLGLPTGTAGVLVSGGSAANLTALLVAREAAGGPSADSVVYVSDQAHSSLARTARAMGLGSQQVPVLPTDDRWLSRGFRALKVWVTVHTIGLAAFRAAIQRNLELAEYAETLIRRHPELTLMAPATLGIVCFRREWPGCDEAGTEEITRRWDSDRFFYIVLSGRYDVFIDSRLIRTMGPGDTSASSPPATGEAATATPALPPSGAPNPAGC